MISIVMATYNGEAFLEKQLQSLLNQTRQPDEVMISDDGSDDRTVEILHDFIGKNSLESWKVSERPKKDTHLPGHVSASVNFMETANKAGGDIIFFCDQDDIWHPRKIEVMVDLMEQHDKILNLFCSKFYIDKDDDPIKTESHKEFRCGTLTEVSMFACFGVKKNWNRPSATGMCMAVRKALIKDILESGLFYSFHDCICACVAAAMRGLFFYNEPLVYYRLHGNNVSASKFAGKDRKRDLTERIGVISERNEAYQTALAVLHCYAPGNQALIEKKFYKKCVNANILRVNYLKNKDFLNGFLMLPYIPKHITLKEYIGDTIYLLGLEKYFK